MRHFIYGVDYSRIRHRVIERMANVDEERYLRNLLLLGKGTSFVLKSLVVQEVSRSGKTLENLLLNNRTLFNGILKEQRDILYPAPLTANADLTTWDLSLLLLVVKKLFYPALQPVIASQIAALKVFRDSIQGHPCKMSMDETEFLSSQGHLQGHLRTIAGYVNQSRQIEDIITQTATGNLDIESVFRYVKETHAFSTSFKLFIEERFKQLNPKLMSLESDVKNIKGCQDRISQTVSKIRNQSVRKTKYDFTKDLNTILQAECENEEKQKKATDLLFDFVKIIQDDNTLHNDEIKTIISQRVEWYGEITFQLIDDLIEWFTDIDKSSDGIGTAQLGCIILPIFCSSVTGCFTVLEYVNSSQCKKHLSRISTTVSTLLGFPCSFTWRVEPTNLQSVLSFYWHDIGTESSKKNLKKLVLPVYVTDIEGLTQVWKMFGGQERNRHLENVSRSLSAIFKDDISLRTYIEKDQLLEIVKEAEAKEKGFRPMHSSLTSWNTRLLMTSLALDSYTHEIRSSIQPIVDVPKMHRLHGMDKDGNFSDEQTNMDHRSKFAFFEKMDVANRPKQTETEHLRRIYRQVKPATMMDKKFPQSSGKIAQARWSPKDLEIFQRPMCLIGAVSVTNEKGEVTKTLLETQEEALDQISKIDLPLVVVAVVGLYRTGKSYLMNRLAGSNKGFALGDTIESKTKGIWAWCKLHPTQSNTVLLLLDTEGLGDVEKGDPSHDNKIFTLATLLCNCLVYNMKGVFDNDAVVKLTFVTEMAKGIKFRGKASEDNHYISLILPDFVLCLRDFSLKLISGGRKITENEYLEQSLADNKSQAKEFNKPRECIKKYFRKRECFAFPVPGDGDVLENLETLRLSDLSTRFKEATARFVSYIYSLPPKELLVSTPVKGRMFKVLVEEYVTAIRQGAVPDVDGAFLAVAKIENEKTKKIAVDNFEKQLQKTKLPVSSNVLMTAFTEAETEALNYFRENVVHDKDFEYEHQAQIEMDRIWNQVKEENDVKVRTMSRTKLQEAYEKNMKLKIQNDDYKTAGGYRKYQCDVESLQKEYFSSLRGFNENEILRSWHEFVTDMKETEAKIVQADDDLSQKEKEEEQKRNEENTRQLLIRQEEANKEELEKQKKELEDHFKTIENERKKKEEADEKKLEELVHKKMEEEAAKKELETLRAEKKDRKKRGFLTRLGDALWNT